MAALRGADDDDEPAWEGGGAYDNEYADDDLDDLISVGNVLKINNSEHPRSHLISPSLSFLFSLLFSPPLLFFPSFPRLVKNCRKLCPPFL